MYTGSPSKSDTDQIALQVNEKNQQYLRKHTDMQKLASMPKGGKVRRADHPGPDYRLLTCGIPISGELYELVSEGWARRASETHPVWLVCD